MQTRQERADRIRILLAVAGACVATIASNSAVPGGDIRNSAGPFSVTLDANTPDAVATAEALLETSGAIESGSGEVELSVSFPAGSVGQVRCGITSVTTGELSEIDVFDPEGQPFVSFSIPAFEGCADTTSCGESFEVRFERLEADVTNELSLDWSIDGAVSTVDDADGGAETGTLTFHVEP